MGNSGSKEQVPVNNPTPVVVPGKTVDYSNMKTLRYGDTGEAVSVLQARLKELGFFSGQALGNFLDITKDAVLAFQRARGLTPDAVVGKVTWAQLGKNSPAIPTIPVEEGDAPWMDFILHYLGKSESDKTFSKWLSGFWKKYTGLNYTSIAGSSNAWCALFANTALEETGFKGTGSAAAASFREHGTPCDYVYGAMIPIRHKAGNNHITFFVSWIDKSKKIAKCLGGNQNNEVRYTAYNLSGNDAGHDEVLYGPRWPKAKPGTVVVTPTTPTKPVVDTGSTRIVGSWEASGHTERAPWTDKIVELFKSNFALFAGAKDVTEICPKFHSLTDRLKLKVLLEFWIAVAYYESGYNPKSSAVDVGTVDNRNSYSDGLYQVSGTDRSARDLGYDYKKLLEPIPNIEVSLEQLRKQVVKEGLFMVRNSSSMRYWAVILKENSRNKIPQILDRVRRNAPECF